MYTRSYAPRRNTEIGTMIEAFMDDNTDYLSPDLWDKLEELGKEVDAAALKLEEHIDNLNSQIED